MKPLFCALTLLLSCLLVSKAEATTQVLSITGSYTSSKAPNGDVTITITNGVVVFEAPQPVPIVVVGLKKTGQTITITNPNHVSISGNNTSDASAASKPAIGVKSSWPQPTAKRYFRAWLTQHLKSHPQTLPIRSSFPSPISSLASLETLT